MSKVRVRPKADGVDQAGALLTLGVGLVLLVFDGGMALLTLPTGSADVLGAYFLVNALAIFGASQALTLKFREAYWPTVGLSAAIASLALCLGISGYAGSQLLEQQSYGILILALPAIFQLRAGLRLISEDRGLKASDVTEAEAEAEALPAAEKRTPIVIRMVIVVSRLAVNLVVWGNVLLFVSIWALRLTGALAGALMSEQGVGLLPFIQFMAEGWEEVLGFYTNAAWPVTQWILIFLAVIAGATLGIGLPLSWVTTARLEQLDTLSDAQLDWIEASRDSVLAWVEAHPKRMVAGLLLAPVIVGSVMVFGGLGGVLPWAISFGLSHLFNPLDEAWSVGGLSFFAPMIGGMGLMMVGVGLALILVQTGRLRPYWFAMQAEAIRSGKAHVSRDLESALQSAAKKGWYPTDRPIDPAAFHDRWMARARSFCLRCIPPFASLALLASLFDATWYTSWSPQGVWRSPPLTIGATMYAYAEAQQVETQCRYAQNSEGNWRLTRSYTLIYEGGARLTLPVSFMAPKGLDKLTHIHGEVTQAGVPIVLSERATPETCRDVLIERLGEDGRAIAAILIDDA